MASTYLTRTPSSNGNRQVFTFSFWLKRTKLGSTQYFISQGSDNDNNFAMYFDANDHMGMWDYGSGYNWRYTTNRKFKDPNAWYHVLLRASTTDGTAQDRMKLYINGVQETSFSTNTTASSNLNTHVNQSGNALRIGIYTSGSSYFDGSIAHFHLADGTAYTPSTFGETDATTGIWKPKTSPTVTYGTNGFFLEFNNSANMGLDTSGQTNNLTTSGTVIQTKDTPSNFFTANNNLWAQESTRILTFTNINNMISGGGSSTWYQCPATLAFSKGKYYWECKFNAGTNLDKNTPGVIDYKKTQESGQFQDKTGSVFYKNEDGGETRIDGSTSSADYGTLAQNDILGVAVDMDAATPTVKFYKNGSLLVTANASSLSGKFVTPAQSVYTSGEYQVNYGNGYFGDSAVSSAGTNASGIGIFEHDVPANYTALSTKGLNE